jgi:hypothetical protein
MPREHFTSQTLNAYLDTSAGQVQIMAHGGSRAAAAQALSDADAADRAWRRRRAEERFERQPDRFESPSHAMASIADPAGGAAAVLNGTEQEIVNAARRADPARAWHVVPRTPDATVTGVSQSPGSGLVAADMRPPWQRD